MRSRSVMRLDRPWVKGRGFYRRAVLRPAPPDLVHWLGVIVLSQCRSGWAYGELRMGRSKKLSTYTSPCGVLRSASARLCADITQRDRLGLREYAPRLLSH